MAGGVEETGGDGVARHGRAALLALVGFALVYALYYLRLLEVGTAPAEQADYALNLALSRQTAAAGAYPDSFFYPPPYLALVLALGALPGQAGFLLWSLAQALSLVAVLLLVRRLAAPAGALPPIRLALLGALGLLAAHYGLHWDFRAHNVNLPVLALVSGALALGPRRALAAGLLLALAGALKLYALVLLPWLLLRRDWRWLAATLGWLALLFLLPPLLAFGFEPAVALTADWLGCMAGAGEAATLAAFPGALASPRALLAALTGRAIEDAALALPAALWALAGGALAVWCAWRVARALPEGPLRRLLAGSALALMPLVASPVAQPHHAAGLLPLTLWLAWRAPAMGGGSRRGAGGLALLALLLLLAALPYAGGLLPGPLFRVVVVQASLAAVWLAVGLAVGAAVGSPASLTSGRGRR